MMINSSALAQDSQFSFDDRDELSTIKVNVSGDHYLGEPKFRIWVNGEIASDVYTVSAMRSAGQQETFELRGDFGDMGPQSVSVEFLNDRYDGRGKDRNLIVHDVEVNGRSYGSEEARYERGYDGKELDGRSVMSWSGKLEYGTADAGGPNWVEGNEDSFIGLNLDLPSTDSGFSVDSVTIDGVPETGKLSEGIRNEDGTWTLTADEARRASVTQAENSAEDFQLKVVAEGKDSETGEARSEDVAVSVRVNAVADVTSLNIDRVQGFEDSSMAVDFRPALSDTDGSEIIDSIIVSGMPDGSTFSAGTRLEDGTWNLAPEDLESLSLKAGNNSDEDFTLSVAVTSRETENGSTATTVHNVDVGVEAVADGVTMMLPQDMSTIRLRISGEAFNSENDAFAGPPEFYVYVDGKRTGDIYKANANAQNGEWEIFSIVGDYGEAGPENVSIEFTNDLWCCPNCADRNLVVDWIEVNGHVYESETDSRYLRYEIAADGTGEHCDEFGNPVTGVETGTGYQEEAWLDGREQMNWEGRLSFDTRDNGGPEGVRGDEDTAIALTFDMSMIDSDGSEIVSEIVIDKVPEGAVLSAGTDRGDGVWSLTSEELQGLTVTPPINSDEDFALGVTINTTESENGDTRSQFYEVPVVVDAVADAPLVKSEDVFGTEGEPVALSLGSAVTDVDGSERLHVVLTGIPAGSMLSSGIENEDGTWTVEADALEELVLTPPANVSGEIQIGVTAVSTESENADQASATSSFSVTLEGVGSAPEVVVEAAAGLEDNTIALKIDASTTDANEFISAIEIDNVPEGATLSAGTLNENGSWTLTEADLEGLTVTPGEHSDDAMDLKVSVTSKQKDNGEEATTVKSMPVSIKAVADAPDLVLTNGDGVTSTIRVTLSGDHYKGEPLYQVFINGEQYGGTRKVLADRSKGETEVLEIVGQYGIDGPSSIDIKFLNDRWEGSGKDRNLHVENLEVNGTDYSSKGAEFIRGYDGKSMTGMAAMFWSGTMRYDTSDNDGPGGARGLEDQPIDLHIATALIDTDGSETLESVVFNNVPADAVLSAGVKNSDGSWTLTADELESATITAGKDSNEDMMLSVTATSVEATGDRATTTVDVPVRVRGVADAPVLKTEDAVGIEDAPIALNIGGELTDIDGSEALSFVVDHVPEGSTLSAGTQNEDGTWTLTEEQLNDLTISTPENFSGEFEIGVTAVSTENDGDVAKTVGSINVSIDARADRAVISRKTANASEDGTIPLTISVRPADDDGSERIGSVTLTGFPAGSVLSAGIDNGDGSWTLTNEELSGLTLTPPKDSNNDFRVKITAETIEENGDTATSGRWMTVKLKGVADAPEAKALDVSGQEDAAIALQLNAELTDNDGSEELSVLITGVPAGSVLSSGTDLGNGVWSVDSADLMELSVTPPRNFSGRIDLEMKATSRENDGDAAHTAVPFSVNVEGVADRAHLEIRPAKGLEDNAIALDIRSSLVDGDGSEELSFVISNVPEGAVLSNGDRNSDGTWSLNAADVAGLTITPPKDSNEDFSLAVTATTTEEDGDTSGVTLALPVKVTGVADTPSAVARDVTGSEDTAITLGLKADVADRDGSEQVSIVIDGLPNGARLSHGLYNGNGTWSIAPEDLDALTVTPPQDFSGEIDMSMRVISTENDGDSTSVELPFKVKVQGVVDTPGGLSKVAVLEDTSVAIDISPRTSDIDGSETVVSAIVSGVPVNAALSAGTEIQPGVWSVDASEFEGLHVSPAHNSNVDFTLTVEATVREDDGATHTFDRTMHVNAVGDADTPDVWAYDVAGESDQPIALDFGGKLNDLDGSEHLYFIIEDIPRGMTFNNGFNNGDGTWTVPKAHMEGLTGTSPFHYEGKLDLTIRAVARENDGDIASNTTTFVMEVDRDTSPGGFYFFGLEDKQIGFDVSSLEERGADTVIITGVPEGVKFSAGEGDDNGNWKVAIEDTAELTVLNPEHSDDDFRVGLTWTDANGNEQSAAATVEVLGVADKPSIELAAEDAIEDTPFGISVTGEIYDLDGSEKLSFVVRDLPEGSSLSAGYLNPISNVWTLTPEDMDGLAVTPPEDFSGDLNFTVGAVATEQSGDYAVTLKPVSVHVEAVADKAEIIGNPETGVEDTAMSLNLEALTTDDDGSEKIVAVNISDLPAGAVLLNATDNGDGSWTVDPDALDTVQIIPPENQHGTFSVTVTATSAEPNGDEVDASGSVSFYVGSDPDQPTVVAADVMGKEDEGIELNLSAKLVDQDGSEVMSVRIDNIPDGSTLSAGFNNGDGTWTVTGNQLVGLTLNPPADFSGELDMGITGISLEMDTGKTNQTETVPFKVVVEGVADAPTVDPQAAKGIEDNAIPVLLNAGLTDVDGSETLSAIFHDYPEGTVFSSGQEVVDGWEVAGEDFDGLTLTPPAHSDQNFDMGVTVISTEASGDQASTDTTVHVNITATADGAKATANDVSGQEDTAVSLDLAAELIDTDGSEMISAIVTGVPVGGSLSHGSQRSDGGWTVSPADLPLLTMTTPENFSGEVEMTLITTTIESANGSEVTSTKAFNVSVEGVADAPQVIANATSGEVDEEIAMDVSTELTDLDGSESLSVLINGVPDGAVLSSGTRNDDGTWSVSDQDLPGLSVTPPAGFFGDIELGIQATSTEVDGDTATTDTTVTVTINEPAPEPQPVAVVAGPSESESGEGDEAAPRAAASDEAATSSPQAAASDDTATRTPQAAASSAAVNGAADEDEVHMAASSEAAVRVERTEATEQAVVDAMTQDETPASSSDWTADIETASDGTEPRVDSPSSNDPLTDDSLAGSQPSQSAENDPLTVENGAEAIDAPVEETLTIPVD